MLVRYTLPSVTAVALALTLALLAHDVLMAADGPIHPPQHRHHATAVASTDRSIEAELLLTVAPMHPEGCAPSLPAVTPLKWPPAGSHTNSVVLINQERHFAMELIEARHPPTSPPQVRRALFQVYQI